MAGRIPALASRSRVWIIEDRAAPNHPTSYYGRARAQGLASPAGDTTPVYEPDPFRYGEFGLIEQVRGAPGLGTTTLEAIMDIATLSRWLQLKRKGCPVDIQIHLGLCKNPDDFNGGFETAFILEDSRITAWNSSEIGALNQGQDAAVNEMIPISFAEMYQLKGSLRLTNLAPTEVAREVLDVDICDRVSCGICGATSDGCQKVFAITVSAGGSPGLPADVLYSSDGGTTIGETNITTLAVNEDPSDAACIGAYYVVVSHASDSLHYADQSDILDGIESWTENAAGIVAAGSPLAIFSISPSRSWVVGDGGYVYFYEDITGTPVVQSSGNVTAENLNAIHGASESDLVAVGDNNAVIYTEDGGDTWTAVTGPVVGVALNTVWVFSSLRWLVGTAGGELWYTEDQGVSWTEIAFPGSGAGVVYDLDFPTDSVGFMSHSTATPAGRILRSIDGGHTWVVQPTVGTGVANDQYNAVVGCPDEPNIAFAGGLADNGTDGVLVKAS